MAELNVEIVSEEKSIWTGTASAVSARTINGEIGILPGHTPMLAVLGDGEVVVRATDGGTITAQANGGFFSVDDDRVVIAAATAQLGGAAA
ncbi:F0F1 ATP synthase subunit epsilon [Micrococcus porci]|uniref:F0F1 ATP synthase subunit epsilon n=1 Tax=Micrococcus TaxID=1269 RepID=UPI001CCED240|nr:MULTISPECIES: F0F1 ATP synthase subunit epsilon [Micrococcus]MCG7422200.1 F0F1 ATP synthase subunit epsilon [Micrococcus sp. ACRRV]UBH24230.1 F0F1 ATP synthase subunit epsilon [Micrococcus porci]